MNAFAASFEFVMSSKRKSNSYLENKQRPQTVYKHSFPSFSSQSERSNKAILFHGRERFFNPNKLAILIGIRSKVILTTSEYKLCKSRLSVFSLRFINFSALQGVKFAKDSLFLT